MNAKFFRKGGSGNWKAEMPEWMQKICWRYHGATLEACGYQEDGSRIAQIDMDKVREHIHQVSNILPSRKMMENIRLELTKTGLL